MTFHNIDGKVEDRNFPTHPGSPPTEYWPQRTVRWWPYHKHRWEIQISVPYLAHRGSIQRWFGAGIRISGRVFSARTPPDGSLRLTLRWRRARRRWKAPVLYFIINIMRCYEILWNVMKNQKCYETIEILIPESQNRSFFRALRFHNILESYRENL
jgi:hypothetical protein